MSKEIIVKVSYVKLHVRKEKEFIIQIVPNRFNVDYADYIKSANKVFKLNDQLKKAGTIEAIENIESEMFSLGLESILEKKYGLVKTLMIANDYDYDVEWWDKRADPTDIEALIAKCIMKDRPCDSKKKK